MRRFATTTLLTLSLIAACTGAASAKQTPIAEEETSMQSALWLRDLESWQQAYDSSATVETVSPLQTPDVEVKVVPTEIYIIRWWKQD